MKASFTLVLVSLFLLSITLIPSCSPKSEEIVTTYVTGEVSRRHTEINGIKEGKMTEYFKDGSIKAEMEFKNGLQIGKSVIYYPSGKVRQVQYYEEGKLHGADTMFYENGKPEFLRTFSKGLKDGYVRKWNENDSLIYEAKFLNDTVIEVKGQALYPDTLSGKK